MDSTPTTNGSSVYPSTPQPSTDLPPPTDLDPFSLQWLRQAIASQQYSPTLMRTALLYDAKTPKQQREVIAKTLANCVELMEELQGPESVGEGQMSHGEREFPASGTAEEGKEHGEPTADVATAQVDRKVMLERCEETFRLAGTVQRVLIAGARLNAVVDEAEDQDFETFLRWQARRANQGASRGSEDLANTALASQLSEESFVTPEKSRKRKSCGGLS